MVAPPDSQVIGRYRIYGQIARGGMATVHFGRLDGSSGFRRTVAIKRLHPHLVEEPEFVATLLDEARIVARIRHPNVVPTLDFVATEGELIVVMEYVRGQSLARLLKSEAASGRRVPLPIVSAVAVNVLHGLHAAHEAKSESGSLLEVVHRDVSPQNVIVGTDGMARILDFGVAKAAGRISTTRDNAVKGKLSYMAPEQLGSGRVTRRADLYAMSIVLWEMLTGRRMIDTAVDGELIGKIMACAWDPPSRHTPGLPKELDALVMKNLAYEPEDRFGSAREMADALMRAVPPAFPTEVGAWVEETARQSLAQQDELLADVEKRSQMSSVPPSATDRPAPHARPHALAGDSADASQASSLTLETPNHVRSGARPRASRWVGPVAVGVVLVAVTAVAITQSHTRHAAGPALAASATSPAAADPLIEGAPANPGAAPLSSAPPPAETASSPPASPSPSRGRGGSRPRAAAAAPSPPPPAASTSDALIFKHPD